MWNECERDVLVLSSLTSSSCTILSQRNATEQDGESDEVKRTTERKKERKNQPPALPCTLDPIPSPSPYTPARKAACPKPGTRIPPAVHYASSAPPIPSHREGSTQHWQLTTTRAAPLTTRCCKSGRGDCQEGEGPGDLETPMDMEQGGKQRWQATRAVSSRAGCCLPFARVVMARFSLRSFGIGRVVFCVRI